MALILNIETATNICSVALGKNGKLIAIKESDKDKSHASLLTVFIDEILKDNNYKASDIDAVAVSKGPGSYTGLRIGVSVAKGICFGIEKPLIEISTLQSLALSILSNDEYKTLNINKKQAWLCPMLDARRMEVYCAIFDYQNIIKRDISADIINKESFKDILTKREVVFFGNGSNKCKEILINNNSYFIDNINSSAKYMINLAEELFNKNEFVDTAYFEPFYLKDFVATTPKKKVL
ncbi:MAG: tRNA (adenosine(37)-N6)-threonylcarbamoyltransferase complex dimerization subunit type 1 TsaB [Bacteroidales bacterium]|nr:tRNA (adenosine(37)-N6)-threonylcarbamoyltransferase complex dimerization subunit type 1 TsaB [Bacteroidales bacterium]